LKRHCVFKDSDGCAGNAEHIFWKWLPNSNHPWPMGHGHIILLQLKENKKRQKYIYIYIYIYICTHDPAVVYFQSKSTYLLRPLLLFFHCFVWFDEIMILSAHNMLRKKKGKKNNHSIITLHCDAWYWVNLFIKNNFQITY
jgi:hypothetical protein